MHQEREPFWRHGQTGQEKKLLRLADTTSIKLDESSRMTSELDRELSVILEKLYDLFEKKDF